MADNAVTQVLKKGPNVKANPKYLKLFDEGKLYQLRLGFGDNRKTYYKKHRMDESNKLKEAKKAILGLMKESTKRKSNVIKVEENKMYDTARREFPEFPWDDPLKDDGTVTTYSSKPPKTEEEAYAMISKKAGTPVTPDTPKALIMGPDGWCCEFNIPWCCNKKWPWEKEDMFDLEESKPSHKLLEAVKKLNTSNKKGCGCGIK